MVRLLDRDFKVRAFLLDHEVDSRGFELVVVILDLCIRSNHVYVLALVGELFI